MARTAILTLLLLLVPAAAAQQTPLYTISAVTLGDDVLSAGESTNLTVTLMRTCPSAAGYYDSTAATLQFTSMPFLTITGPSQITFPSQTCATQQTVSVGYLARIQVAPDLNLTDDLLTQSQMRMEANGNGPIMTAGSAEAKFTLTLQAHATSAAAALDSVGLGAKASPMPVAGLLAIALLAAAAGTLRRQQ